MKRNWLALILLPVMAFSSVSAKPRPLNTDSTQDIPPISAPLTQEVMPTPSTNNAPFTPASNTILADPTIFKMPEDITLTPDQQTLRYLYSHHYLASFADNRFYPDLPISRADFLTLLYRAAGYKTPFVSDYAYFRDVPIHSWAYFPIEAMRMRHITIVDSKGYFHPQSPLSRKDAAVFISQSFPKDWLVLTPDETNATLKAYGIAPESITTTQRTDLARAIFAGYLLPQSQTNGPAKGDTDTQTVQPFTMALNSPLSRMDAAHMVYQRAMATEENADQGGEFAPLPFIPPGVALLLTPTSAISQTQLAVNQTLYFALLEPVEVPSLQITFPRSTRVSGKITALSADKRHAQVTLDRVNLLSGQLYTISGTINIDFKPPKGKNATAFTVPGEKYPVTTQKP